ncbi:MAG TPA: protease pro-enzyme activation domain-containing protein [Acetobacteraceae bacterium]|nr:protease pro-enzyme activation domain-containing protein [Acetobacteraceae bacterium]
MHKLLDSFRRPPRAPRIGDVADDRPIRLTIVLRPGTPLPSPPAAGRALSHAEYRDRHATPSAVLDQVTTLAQRHGLRVVETSGAQHMVRLEGTYGQARAAFQPEGLGLYRLHGREVVARDGHLFVPEALARHVVAVMGFDQRPVVKPHFRLRPAATLAWDPAAVAARYQFPTGVDGIGQAIALIEFGGGFDPDDVGRYFAARGVRRSGRLVAVAAGASNAPDRDPNGADGEVQLDIDVAGSVAPGADLVVYFGENAAAGFIDAIQAAIGDETNHPAVISLSWGAPEAAFSAQDLQAIDQALQSAAALGITVCAASGDSGATEGSPDGSLQVDFPASSPHALGCGGTRLPQSGAETAWNDGPGQGASGGGYSAVFPIPAWQAGVSGPGRGVPDVAGDADPATGYRVQVDGQATVAGGTSAVAPLWAGLVARLNQSLGRRVGFINPTLYAHPEAFADVTAGDNGGFQAGPGWDPVTGLGSPIGTALLAALRTAPAQEAPPMGTSQGPAATPSGPSGATSATTGAAADHPFLDPVAYGNGPQDAVADPNQGAAVTHHSVTIDGRAIAYTATAGHLTAVDPVSSKPAATFFYVAFTADAVDRVTRPVTFFYNGGPGSSSVYVLLGSFGPRRIRTSLPDFTPPPPYTIEDNPDSLLDRSDLVFVNPVGTGYSAAIAPKVNKDFWGVDQDAASICQFIKRYLTANDRWNSPKFLFGESYGTARTAVLSYRLHEDGIDLNGLTIQSSILDYAQAGDPVGLLPTWAADAWYHDRTGVAPRPASLAEYAAQASAFADGPYATALARFPDAGPAVVQRLSALIGISPTVLTSWSLNVAATDGRGTDLFLVTLLKDKGLALGAYDGRATGIDTGIAARIDPMSGGNDPTMTAVNGVYTAMWNTYLNDELKYTCDSAFTDLNDLAFQNWDFHHIDPTGAERGIDAKGNIILYTAGDLAATMSLNIDLKVLSANGYYDSVTPFHRTALDLASMPVIDKRVRANLTIRNYPSGHMIYLDAGSRTALKADLARMYDSATADHPAMARVRVLQQRRRERFALVGR